MHRTHVELNLSSFRYTHSLNHLQSNCLSNAIIKIRRTSKQKDDISIFRFHPKFQAL